MHIHSKIKRYKTSDYTMITVRLITVCWCDNSHPTRVVNQVLGSNLPTCVTTSVASAVVTPTDNPKSVQIAVYSFHGTNLPTPRNCRAIKRTHI